MNNDQSTEIQGESQLCRAITLLEQSAAPFDEACRILRELASGEAGMLVRLVPVRTLQDSINEWDELIAGTDINAPVPATEEASAWFEPSPEWVMWQATDGDGKVYGYELRPTIFEDEMLWHNHANQPAELLTTVPPPANWRETLVARPGHSERPPGWANERAEAELENKPESEVKTCATHETLTREDAHAPDAPEHLSPKAESQSVASPAPQQSNPADRGARGLPPEPMRIGKGTKLPPEPVAEPEDREWAREQVQRHYQLCISVENIILAAIARGRAQARTSPGENGETVATYKKGLERVCKAVGIDTPLQLIAMAENNEEDMFDLLIKHLLKYGVRAAQNAGEGRKP